MTAIIAFIIFSAALISLGAYSEARQWNGGICADYGEAWLFFDTDSQGGRGYMCRDKTIWISYPVDRRLAR